MQRDWLRIYHPDPAAWAPRIAEATQAIVAAGGRVIKTDIITSPAYCGASVFLTWEYRAGERDASQNDTRRAVLAQDIAKGAG